MTTEELAPVVRSTGRARGTALIMLASLCFSTSGLLAKPIIDAGLGPQQVACVRIGLAALILLAVVAVTRPRSLRVPRALWRMVLAYGLVAVAMVQLAFFIAVSRIPIGIAMLFEYIAPALVALWVRFVRGTLLPPLAWAGTGLALAGLALVAKVWEGLAFDAVGMLAGFAAALGAATYYLLGARAIGSVEPVGLVTWGMIIGAVTIAVVAPPWTISAGILDDTARFGPWDTPVWTLMLAVAVVSTAMAYLLSISAMRHLPVNVVSVLALVEPIAATALAWALFSQALTAVQVVGAVVLLGGATLVQVSSAATDTRCPPTTAR